MSWKIKLILSCIVFFQSIVLSNSFLDGHETLDIEKALKKYGVSTFKPELFKNGSLETRAKMAVSIIQNKTYLGKKPEAITEELGSSTVFFWSDSIPAYVIEESTQKGQHPWQLVFLLNQKGTVGEVRILRNRLLGK
jgi:hypothetical protein